MKLEPGFSRNADDVFIYVSCRSDIEVVRKVLERYEKLTGTKINRNKSSDLRLGAWKGSHFQDHFVELTDLCAFLECGTGPGSSWRRISRGTAKILEVVQTWLRKRLSVKGRAEPCATIVFLFILYRLSVLSLCKDHRKTIERLLSSLL